MSKVRLTGTTSGFTELTAPAVAGSNTLTLPTGNGTADQRLVTNGSGALSFTSDVMLAAGSAGSPSLYFSGDTNTGIFSPGADQVAISTNGTGRLFVDASGRVGVGPINNSSNFSSSTNRASTTYGFAVDTYNGASFENTLFFGFNGSVQNVGNFQNFPFALLTNNTERLRITSAGNVGIGTNNPGYRPDVQGGNQRILNQGTNSILEIGAGTTTNQNALIDLVGDTTYTDYGLRIIRSATGANSASAIEHRGTGSLFFTTVDAANIAFNTNSIQRMVISDGGPVAFTSPAATQSLTVSATAAAFTSAVLIPQTTRAAGTNCFYIYGVANNVNTFLVYNNGNVLNTNNSYGALSDIKLKENIVDAASQWSDIKDLQVRKYNFKEETGHQTHTQIGLVAQELELVSPGLVTESFDRDEEGNELETTTKSINYSVLYMKAVKALQEAMERIEALEARITALEVN